MQNATLRELSSRLDKLYVHTGKNLLGHGDNFDRDWAENKYWCSFCDTEMSVIPKIGQQTIITEEDAKELREMWTDKTIEIADIRKWVQYYEDPKNLIQAEDPSKIAY